MTWLGSSLVIGASCRLTRRRLGHPDQAVTSLTEKRKRPSIFRVTMLAPLIYTSPLNAIPQHHREASQSKWAYDIILNTFPFTWPPPPDLSIPAIYISVEHPQGKMDYRTSTGPLELDSGDPLPSYTTYQYSPPIQLMLSQCQPPGKGCQTASRSIKRSYPCWSSQVLVPPRS